MSLFERLLRNKNSGGEKVDSSIADKVDAAMDEFEKHLSQIPRVLVGDPKYPESEYSHLMEAMIVAYFAKAAFVNRTWDTDVHGMLQRWLPSNLCVSFFRGDEGFIEVFRNEMTKRAKLHILEQGEFDLQYSDLERGIREANPNSMHVDVGGPFGITTRPSRITQATVESLLKALDLDSGAIVDAAATKFHKTPDNVRAGCRQFISIPLSDAGRKPESWDDLESILSPRRRTFWHAWPEIVLAQIRAAKNRPFPEL